MAQDPTGNNLAILASNNIRAFYNRRPFLFHILKKTGMLVFMQNIYEKYMFFIGIAGQMVFYLQAYEIFSAQKAENVSLTAFIFGLVSVSSWLIYGVIIKNRPLIVANSVAVIGALAVVVGIITYS
jgi:MtN3 and saliva related transmembrane protein